VGAGGQGVQFPSYHAVVKAGEGDMTLSVCNQALERPTQMVALGAGVSGSLLEATMAAGQALQHSPSCSYSESSWC